MLFRSIGITDFAQHAVGDIVFFEMPKVGAEIAAGGALAVVESVKATSDIYSPAAGVVVEVNSGLEDDPAQANEYPYESWIARVQIPGELPALMDAAAYAVHCEKEG